MVCLIANNSIKIAIINQNCISQYKNLKRKILKCNLNIYFNKQCVIRGLIPKYVHIKAPFTFPTAKLTVGKSQNIHIKDEMKFLYMKKQKMNHDLRAVCT